MNLITEGKKENCPEYDKKWYDSLIERKITLTEKLKKNDSLQLHEFYP